MASSSIHKAPAFIVCLSLITGILLQHYYQVNNTVVIVGFIIGTLVLVISQFFKIKRRSQLNIIYLTSIIILFIALGNMRYGDTNRTNRFEKPIKATFTATLLEIPVKKANSYGVEILIDSAYSDSSHYCVNAKAIAYIQKSPKIPLLKPGERIRFSSILNTPSGQLNPEDFNYKIYLERYHIFATCYIRDGDWQLLDDELFTLRIRAARIQQRVVSIFESFHYDKEELALISALTVGYRDLIEKDQRMAYVSSGATHVLAVSGLHVGIIYLFILRIFRLFGKSRKIVIIRVIITIITLWCFALITGLSPSVTRASVMFTLVSIGSAGKQKSSIFNTIFLSAFILLFINPQLLFDIGFQLSYAAVLGIVAFQPYFSTLFNEKWHIPKFLADLMAVSMAAQIGTAPISIHIFNCFPTYFILTNIWIIPLVAIIVNYAIILILTSLTGVSFAGILSIPLHILLKIMNGGVKIISQLPYSLSEHLYIDRITVLLLYFSIIMLIMALDYHSKNYLFMVFSSIIVALSLNIYQQEQQKTHNQLFVFYDREGFNIAAQQGLKSHIISDNKEIHEPTYFIHHYLSKKNQNKTSINDKHNIHHNLLHYNDFIITPKHIHAIYSQELDLHSGSINITSMIINKSEPKSIYYLYKTIHFKTLVIYQRPEKSIGYYRRFCEKYGINMHLVYKDGAYIEKF